MKQFIHHTLFSIRLITLLVCLSLLFCGTIPSDTSNSNTGSLDIRVWINKPQSLGKKLKISETTWENIVIQVSAEDIDTIRDTIAIDMEKSFNTFLMENVSAGENRLVEAWTIDSEGDIIHGKEGVTKNIEPAQTVIVTLELDPIKGSIYIELSDFPSNVDSVLLAFQMSTDTLQVKAKKSSKFYMSLDKIDFGSEGTLIIAGLDSDGDTVASWEMENFIFENTNNTIEASFISVGKISIEVIVNYPGVTLIRGIMDTTDSLDDEQTSTDSLIIVSEIMFTAGSGDNSYDYIELYNPSSSYDSITFDTLIIDLSGSYKYLENVTIYKESFFVVGNDSIPDKEKWGVDTTISLDLVSTSNIITLLKKDESIIDRVFYENDDNIMGWPELSSSAKTSVILDSLPSDAEYNNYGRNWVKAESPVHADYAEYLGTPGRSGF